MAQHESRQWAIDESAAQPIVRAAVEGGITFFDTADVYNGGASEVITGRLLRTMFGMREEYVLATKVHGQTMPGENGRGLSRKHIMASIDASLQRLEVDYVDLYQIHRWDPSTPIEETMDALHDVVKAGKARYIGASSMWAWQFAKAQAVARTRFVSMQNHYNLVYRVTNASRSGRDRRGCGRRGPASCTEPKATLSSAPPPGAFAASAKPPWASAACLTIASPRPEPGMRRAAWAR